MKFSIITASIDRPSLAACKESVAMQTYQDREHIIMLDLPPTGDFGNSARHQAWEQATGDYVIILDDDNFFARSDALSDVAACLMAENYPDWAIFPILRFGQRFCCLPPGNCRTDSANMVIKHEIAQWPNGLEYTMDGLFCEQLKAKFAYSAFPHISPIINVPVQGKGL